MYEIETNVPVPAHARLKTSKYPFELMGVGDSFFVPLQLTDPNDEYGGREPISRAKNRMLGAATFARKRTPEKRFIVRQDGLGIRVWRVE